MLWRARSGVQRIFRAGSGRVSLPLSFRADWQGSGAAWSPAAGLCAIPKQGNSRSTSQTSSATRHVSRPSSGLPTRHVVVTLQHIQLRSHRHGEVLTALTTENAHTFCRAFVASYEYFRSLGLRVDFTGRGRKYVWYAQHFPDFLRESRRSLDGGWIRNVTCEHVF